MATERMKPRDWWNKARAQARLPIPAMLRRRRKPSHADGQPPVVLLHGLMLTRHTMWPLLWRLRRAGRRVYTVPYHTTLHDLPECAHRLAQRLRALNLRDFDAVTHSMGGIILRWAVNNEPGMPRLRRAVLVAPPNAGSLAADTMHRWLGPVFPLVWGQAALQLRRPPRGIAARAGHLHGADVGIIAGGSATPGGLPSLFPFEGDNDGTVSVEETILRGMRNIVLLHHSHRTIYLRAATASLAAMFLEHGVFRPQELHAHGEEGGE